MDFHFAFHVWITGVFVLVIQSMTSWNKKSKKLTIKFKKTQSQQVKDATTRTLCGMSWWILQAAEKNFVQLIIICWLLFFWNLVSGLDATPNVNFQWAMSSWEVEAQQAVMMDLAPDARKIYAWPSQEVFTVLKTADLAQTWDLQ